MKKMVNDIKNLEEVKELIEPDYGKGKEITLHSPRKKESIEHGEVDVRSIQH